ncbi:MAG TPA: hypothetical protein VMU17_03925 [Elusimicrobiota bacterium]|nr:hypothetical protein [Elusimicrobiota bacterium]
MPKRSSAKHEAKKLLDKLPDGASWDDIMYQLYVRQKYDRGIEAADREDGMVHDEVKKLFRPK